MKRCFLFPLLLLLAACDNTPPDLTTTIPIWLGDSHEKVTRILGEADIASIDSYGNGFKSYFKHGVVIDYVNDTVHGITAQSFAAGGKFSGKLFGLQLDSGLDDCEDRFGEYVSSENHSVHTTYTWYYMGNTIKVEVLNESGNWSGGGTYTEGELRTIKVISGVPAVTKK